MVNDLTGLNAALAIVFTIGLSGLLSGATRDHSTVQSLVITVCTGTPVSILFFRALQALS
jgi:hypothetical protein